MHRKPARVIPQHTYRIIQQIHAEAERQRQVDAGLRINHGTPALDARDQRPLYVGGQTIEAVPVGDAWAA